LLFCKIYEMRILFSKEFSENKFPIYYIEFLFLNLDYAEEDELKVFDFILFIFFSVILVQKQKWKVWYAYAWF